ncbi:MAG: paraquat-inducible membrane protein A [Gammaproteobacteria bacterium]|nr:MAG: paraquat-inducible membrane protein A [Gammaproteobacteria bacterium]
MMPRARDLGLISCHLCKLVVRPPQGIDTPARCPRCGSELHSRLPNSLSRTWALLIASMILYIPANVLPIMKTTVLGTENPSTILSGVVYFIDEGDWLLALVIFTASVLVPVLKMLSLLYLLLTLRYRGRLHTLHRSRLHRVTELIGRWSMVDVFVIGILTALVQMGMLTSIEPGMGALAFAAVVILTMFAAEGFDSRLLWDQECRQ